MLKKPDCIDICHKMINDHDIPPDVLEQINSIYGFLSRINIDCLSFQDVAVLLANCGYSPVDFPKLIPPAKRHADRVETDWDRIPLGSTVLSPNRRTGTLLEINGEHALVEFKTRTSSVPLETLLLPEDLDDQFSSRH
jgi:hypothetical protein